MNMSVIQQVIIITAAVVGTIITRSLAFIVFPANKPTPEYIQYLGKTLPSAVIAMLVVYCLKDTSLFIGSRGIPELASIALIVLVHQWKRQMLLSISLGTVCFMMLIQLVF